MSKEMEIMLNNFFRYRVGAGGVAEKTATENCTNIRAFYATNKSNPAPEWRKEEDFFEGWITECTNPSDKRNQRILSMRLFWKWAEEKKKRPEGENYAAAYKIIKVNRVPKIPLRKDVQKFFGILYDEMEKTLNDEKISWAKKWIALRNSVLVSLMACTGIRAGELLKLVPENIDLDNNQIYIPAHVSKNRIERECDILEHEGIKKLIETIKNRHSELIEEGVFQENSPLFAGLGRGSGHINSGKKVRTQAIYTWIKEIYDRKSIKIKGLHDFRRYYATDYIVGCYEKGIVPDVQKLRDVLGHTSLEMTQKYIDSVVARIARKANATDYEPGNTAFELISNPKFEKQAEEFDEFDGINFDLPANF